MNINEISENTSITRVTLPINPDDGDSFVQIVTITAPLGASRYSDAKAALEEINYRLVDDVRIARPYTDYDCTGLPFTTSIDLLSRFCWCNAIHAVYRHHISIDC